MTFVLHSAVGAEAANMHDGLPAPVVPAASRMGMFDHGLPD